MDQVEVPSLFIRMAIYQKLSEYSLEENNSDFCNKRIRFITYWTCLNTCYFEAQNCIKRMKQFFKCFIQNEVCFLLHSYLLFSFTIRL